jgi:exodeoxyribonuclease III
MKLITWNCNMAFRKKADSVLSHNPDIVIVPECEHPEKLVFTSDCKAPRDKLWFGNNRNKGLGIFSYSDYRFKVLDVHREEFRMIVPIEVTGAASSFILFAIWANNPADPDGHYVEQIWKALAHYDKILNSGSFILAGDFNSNTIWDRKRRAGNHSNVVKLLETKGITSMYHLKHQQLQGKEEHPTYYLYRHRNKPYHLDYCFASKDFADRLKNVEIGSYEEWCGLSDHVPVIITFDPEELIT